MASVKLDIKTAVDLQGIKQLKQSIADVQKMLSSPDNRLVGLFDTADIQKTLSAVNTLGHALDSAFDVKLNTINVDKFNQHLASSNMNVKTLYTDLSRLGAEGQQIFMGMTQATLNMGKSVQKTSKFVEEMKDTLTKTIKWGLASSAWNNMLSSASKAFSYVKGLDKDLNNIRIVTGKSADQMERFAKQANKAAKELAVSTRDYVQGALIYYQQGDDDATAQAKANITAKTANVTGQDMSTVSEQLTAVWNGYQVANEAAEKGMQVYEEYADKMAAVAATTASDLEEQATAMSKVASAASALGVEFDELNAQIATVVSVTRQAPESVGNALKTIYARLGDLKVDGIDEFGTSLGEISSQLQVMGIEVLNSSGDMRNMGDVMTDVAAKWDTWTSAQKQAAAVAMAGKRQYNNLIALFDNWDMYGDSLKTSMEATGTLSEQQTIALDSLENKMERMQVAAEKFYDALFNKKSLGGFIDFLTGAIDLIGSMTQGIGGLGTILPMVGGLLLKNFSTDIGRGIATKIDNARTLRAEKANDNKKAALAQQFKDIDYLKTEVEVDKNGKAIRKESDDDATYAKNSIVAQEQKKNVEFYAKMLEYKKDMNNEELESLNILMETNNKNSQRKVQLAEEIKLEKDKHMVLKTQHDELLSIMQDEVLGYEDKKQALQEIYNKANGLSRILNETFSSPDDFNFTKGNLNNLQIDMEQKKENLKNEMSELFGGDKEKENSFFRKIQGLKLIQGENRTEKSKQANREEIKKIYGGNISDEELERLEEAAESYYRARVSIEKSIKLSFNKGNEDYLKIAEAFEKAGITGDELDDTMELIRDELIKGTQAGENYDKVLTETMNKIRIQSEEAANKVQEVIANTIKKQEDDEKIKQEEANKKLSSTITNITKVISGVTTAIGLVRGIGSAFSTAMDTSMDSSERLKSAFSALIPIMVTLATTILTNEKLMGLLAKKTIVATIAEKLKAMSSKIAAAGEISHAVAVGVVIAAIIALIAIIAVVIVAMNAYANKLQANVKKAEALTKEKAKLTEQSKKERDALVAINEELDNLNEQYENNQISLSELRSSIADTCLQYEQYDLAMKALISDYETLNGLVDEAANKENTEYIQDAEVEQEARKNEIKAKLRKEAKSRVDNGGTTFDIDYGLFDSISAEEYKFLAKYNISESGGKININDVVNAATEDYDSFMSDLSKLEGKGFRELSNWLSNTSEEIEKYQETENEIVNAKKQKVVYENTKEEINTSEDYFKVLNDIQKASEDFIKDEVERAEWAKSELFKVLKESGKTNLAYAYEIAVNVNAAQTEEEVEQLTKDIAVALENFNQSEQNFIYLNIKLIQGDNPVEAINNMVDEYGDLIKYNEQKEFSVKIKGVLNKKELTELTEEEIDSLFQNEEFAKQIGISQEDFEILDLASQLSILSSFYTEAEKMSDQYKEKAIEDQKEIEKAYQETKENYVKENKSEVAKNIGKDIVANDLNTRARIGAVAQVAALSSVSTKGEIDLTQSNAYEALGELYQIYQKKDKTQNEKLLLELASNKGIDFANMELSEEAIKALSEYNNQIKAYDEAIKEAQVSQSAIEGDTVDYVGIMEGAQQTQQAFLKNLEDINNTYDTLSNAINDYNEHGYITQDNLQTLLSLSSDQLQYLQFENGQLTMNTELMRANSIAMIENAQMKILDELQTKILLVSQGKLAEAGYKATEVLQVETDTIKNAAIAAQTSAEAFFQLNLAQASLSGVDLAKFTEEQLKAIDQFNEEAMKKFLFYEDAKNNLSSSTRKVDSGDLKILDEEIDRYWTINHLLSEISETMEDLERKQSRLHGKELIQSLKTENKLIEQQSNAYKRLAEEQKAEKNELQEKLSHLGVDFYEDGTVANYNEAMQAAVDRYNAALQDNTITEESRNKILEQYDEFKEMLEEYDDLQTNKINETLNLIEENRLKQLDNNFKSWETEIQIQLDLTEGKRQWEDFIHDINEDIKLEFRDIGADLSTIMNKAGTFTADGGEIDIDLQAIKDVMAEIDKIESGQGSSMFDSISEAQEKLKTLVEDTQDDTLALKDLFAEAWDTYMEGIEQSAEEFEKLQGKYEKINEELEYEKELIELIYGPEAYDRIANVYDAQAYNTLSQIGSLKQQVDLYKSMYDNAEAGSEEQLKYYELFNEAQSELNGKTSEYITMLKDKYSNTVDSILKTFQMNLTGGSTFDDLTEEWERIQEESSKYLDDIEGLYEIQKFANNIQDSINSADSVKNQQKLQDLYNKEIKYLREKEKLTQYDLDAAEARYQITLKEIALEEARNTKDSMKLTRGADGNWSYQYVADEENVSAKQQELSDAYQNLYQLSKDAYQSNIDSIVQLQTDFLQSVKEISDNQVWTTEVKAQKMAELEQRYYDDLETLTEENALYRNDMELSSALVLMDLRNQDEANYEAMTEHEKELVDMLHDKNINSYQDMADIDEQAYKDITTASNSALAEINPAWEGSAQEIANKWSADQDSVKADVSAAVDGINTATTELAQDIKEGMETAGKDVEDLGTDFTETKDEVDEVKSAVNSLVNTTEQKLKTYKGTVDTIATAWAGVSTAVRNALTATAEYFKKVGDYSKDYNFNDKGNVTTGDTSGVKAGQKTVHGEAGYLYTTSDLTKVVTEMPSVDTLVSNKYKIIERDKSGAAYIESSLPGLAKGWISKTDAEAFLKYKEDLEKQNSNSLLQSIYDTMGGAMSSVLSGLSNVAYTAKEIADDLMKQNTLTPGGHISSELKSLIGFDTGGYTGNWGSSDGRMAVLHQKELVLNAKDTENVLNIVSIVRSLEQGIMGKITGMLAGLSGLNSNVYTPSIAGAGEGDSNNIFNITAEFPNANDVTSIKEAILSLPNIASQYISENKK